MTWTRRDVLRAAGALGAASTLPVLPACSDPGPEYVYDGPPSDRPLFLHGVASGDPLVDSVILWTCVELGGEASLEVYVEVYADPELQRRVGAMYLDATEERGGCVKVDLDGLRANQTWYYRFRCKDQRSPIGRTRTAPRGRTERFRLALMSCSNYALGWFHGYRALGARDDLDLVVHAGDYIYEYGDRANAARPVEPRHATVTLDDYRTRYRHYRQDPDLQEIHRQHPMVAVWDDHEVANDGWTDGAQNHDPETEGPWEDRLAAGRQAWFEWLPTREDSTGRQYRALVWGDLVELIALDTRIEGREEQTGRLEIVHQEDRQLLGEEQEAWLLDRLTTSSARWKLILQQVVMAPWVGDDVPPLNADQWDGYPAARRRILGTIRDEGIDGVVVLSGDIHSTWVNDLPVSIDDYDPETREGSVAVEVVTPAITSSGVNLGPFGDTLREILAHVRYLQTYLRGFVVVDVDRQRTQANWWHFEDGATERPDPAEPYLAVSYRVDHGIPHWDETDEPLPPHDRGAQAP